MMMKKQHLLVKDLDYILEHTADVWAELKGARLFITGGTGFFGKWLLESLAWANHRLQLNISIVVLSRNPSVFNQTHPHLNKEQGIEFRSGDVRSFSFPEGSFSHVIHAATEASAKLNLHQPLSMLDTIVQGTWRTLEFLQSAQVKKMLFVSSGAVYGKQPFDLTHVPETYQGAPAIEDKMMAYGNGKRLAEHLCMQFAYQHLMTQIKIARCFAFSGPYLPLDEHFAIGNFIRDGLNGDTIYVQGDGTPYRSYLYAADLVIWLLKILCFGQNAHPYNVGADEDCTIRELAEKVASSFSEPRQVVIAKTPSTSVSKPLRYVPNTERARQELQLPTPLSLEDTINRTIQWHQGI
jgi:dTDP-glucose 4,6-dehydratase